MKIALIVFSLVIAGLRTSLADCEPCAPLNGGQVDIEIARLRSSDARERAAAKEKILQEGPTAVPLLVSLLRDLTFPPGAKATEKGTFETWRLKDDIVELLGRLKAEGAIPLLITLMGQKDIGGPWEMFSPEMRALVQIGPPAVPYLISSIENAEVTARAREFADDPIFTDEVKQRIRKTFVFQIQSRASIVLGEIGDARALPILRKLRRTRNDEFLLPYVERAIEKIQSKIRRKAGRRRALNTILHARPDQPATVGGLGPRKSALIHKTKWEEGEEGSAKHDAALHRP